MLNVKVRKLFEVFEFVDQTLYMCSLDYPWTHNFFPPLRYIYRLPGFLHWDPKKPGENGETLSFCREYNFPI